MNLRALSYIQAVAKFGHFGRAAEYCHVSQPALSTQIKKLEQELGVTLFERDNRSVRLTDVGRDIVKLASEALSVIESIHDTAQMSRDPLSGRFRLGFIPTVAPYLVPHFVKQSREALPALDLSFQEDITDRLNQALLNGDIDAAILATPPDHSKLEAIRLYDEPFWVIFPAEHALHNIQGIRTQDLPIDELLLLTEGHCFRDQALSFCNLDTGPVREMLDASSLSTLVQMVGAGIGVTLIPEMALAMETRAATVSVAQFADPQPSRTIGMIWRKTSPLAPQLQEIAEVVRQSAEARKG